MGRGSTERNRGAQLGALMDLVDRLRSTREGCTLDELAEQVGLHPRSVRRYVQDIASAYYPIEAVQGGDGRRRWRFVEGSAGREVRLALDESFALVRAAPMLRAATTHLPWRSAMERLLCRLEVAVPPALRAKVEGLARVFGAAPPHASGKVTSDVWQVFEDAARDSVALAVRYRALAGRVRERRFDPYYTYVAENAGYCYGHDHLRKKPLALALDRVLAVQPVAGVHFVRPSDFSAEAFLAELHRGFPGARRSPVTLRLSGRAARLWLDRPEVDGQEVELLDGGSVRVRFSAPHTPALVGRLMSFGAELVVEGPDALREQVAAELRRAAAHYGEAARKAGRVLVSIQRPRADRRAKKTIVRQKKSTPR